MEFTYLKNNGLYQKKFNKLIKEGNLTLISALELYNLYHGNTKAEYIKTPLFYHFYNEFKRCSPVFANLLQRHTTREYELLIDSVVCSQAPKL